MHILNSFNNSTSDIRLEASATRTESSIKLAYKIDDPKNLMALPKAFIANENNISREDGLWNDTCFEMFLRPNGSSSYYEFNFSLKPASNEYFFDSYRQPQPPRRSNDFLLNKYQWDGQNLVIEISGTNIPDNFAMSLTAVLKEKTGATHYLAVKHAGQEADFHHTDSFVIKFS